MIFSPLPHAISFISFSLLPADARACLISRRLLRFHFAADICFRQFSASPPTLDYAIFIIIITIYYAASFLQLRFIFAQSHFSAMLSAAFAADSRFSAISFQRHFTLTTLRQLAFSSCQRAGADCQLPIRYADAAFASRHASAEMTPLFSSTLSPDYALSLSPFCLRHYLIFFFFHAMRYALLRHSYFRWLLMPSLPLISPAPLRRR
jgi:hypothetical protein